MVKKERGEIHVRLILGRRGMAVIISLAAMLVLLSGCDARLKGTSVAEMDEMEGRWQAQPILDYSISVDVERPDELRRYEITVENGAVTSAVMSFRDESKHEWREPLQLDETQAFPFTVPGLFETVRGALEHSGRTDIQVDLSGDPAFPRRIHFGLVWEEGQMVRGTESEIRVKQFDVMTSSDTVSN